MEEKRIQGNPDWWYQVPLDPQVRDNSPCEVKGCDDDAEWYMLHRCCSKVFLGCTGHSHQSLRLLKQMANRGGMVKCGWCDVEIAPMDYMTRPQPLRLTAAD